MEEMRYFKWKDLKADISNTHKKFCEKYCWCEKCPACKFVSFNCEDTYEYLCLFDVIMGDMNE